MRLPILMMLIVILLNVAIDCYIYKALKKRLLRFNLAKIHFWGSIILTIAVIVIISLPRRSGSDSSLLFIMWMLFSYMSIYISKYTIVIFDFIASIPQLLFKDRWKPISIIGLFVGVLVFLIMWWGALFNRNAIEIKEVTVEIPNLPSSFEGFKIAQISDLHLGTYQNDTTFISSIVDEVNKLDVDAVMFTGDIVNRNSSELRPFIPVLSRLRARDGVFSILGNHDYGDYSDWESDSAKIANHKLMIDSHSKMGWNLLLNETAYLVRNNDSIAVIGVENLGDPPFKNYGSLSKAYPTINDSKVKILLSHNPAHWDREISNHNAKNVSLTLSGHTHAMQISMFGISPASMRYKYWGGLYSDESGKQKLYVNIGVGTVAIPMRIGATPEITLITLSQSK